MTIKELTWNSSSSFTAEKQISKDEASAFRSDISLKISENNHGKSLLENPSYSRGSLSSCQASSQSLSRTCSRETSAVSTSMPAGSQESASEDSKPLILQILIPGQSRPRYIKYLGRKFMGDEGLCHVYDNGVHIKAFVNGDYVNPEHGLTKMGLPRRRLRKACSECRLKKSKCVPGFPDCEPCERSDRICVYEPKPSQKKSKIKTAYQGTSPSKKPRKEIEKGPKTFANRCCSDQTLLFITSNFSPEMDPAEVDEVSTMNFLHLFFTSMNLGVLSLFPRTTFLSWITCERNKSVDDKLLIYSIMMLACVFLPKGDRFVPEEQLSIIVENSFKMRHGKVTWQLAQIRLVQSLYSFACEQYSAARDYHSQAIEAISILGTDAKGDQCLPNIPDSQYGFSRQMTDECWQRTLWCSILMDATLLVHEKLKDTLFTQKLSNVDERMSHLLPSNKIYTLLPSGGSGYEKGSSCLTALLSTDLSEQGHEGVTLFSASTSLAQLAHLSLIWVDILKNTHRVVYLSPSDYVVLYNSFYSEIIDRLACWRVSILSQMHKDLGDQQICTDMVIGNPESHCVLFHAALIMLQRYVRHSVLPLVLIRRNVYESRLHARKLLSIVSAAPGCRKICEQQERNPTPVRRQPRQRQEQQQYQSQDQNDNYEAAFVSRGGTLGFPFTNFAVIAAADVLSAGGLLGSELLETVALLEHGLDYLASVRNYWASAELQYGILDSRVQLLRSIAAGNGEHTFGRFWRVTFAMTNTFQVKDDILYGISLETFTDAIEHKTSWT